MFQEVEQSSSGMEVKMSEEERSGFSLGETQVQDSEHSSSGEKARPKPRKRRIDGKKRRILMKAYSIDCYL